MSSEGLNLCISQQDVTTVKADVVVSSIHRSRNMKKGPLASHFNRTFGQSVQEDLYKIKRELDHGEVVSICPGQRNSGAIKKLMFVCLYQWRDGNEQNLALSVEECLQKAVKKKYTSIAFPALGMGGQGYPPFAVAQTMVKTIVDFIYTNPDTCLRTVHITLLDKNEHSLRAFLQTTKAFFEGLKKGREMERDKIIGTQGLSNEIYVTGLDAFKDLVFSKPTDKKAPTTPTSLLKTFTNFLHVEEVKVEGGDGLKYTIKPCFSWAKRTIGVSGSLYYGFNKDLPAFMQR